MRWLHASAEQGNQFAQYTLGKLYLNGERIPPNVPEAMRWLHASAEQGNQYAQYTLGKLYLNGESIPPNIPEAMHWLHASAEQGNQFAQYTLGKLYLNGERIPQNIPEAMKWLHASAEQGNEYAQRLLGPPQKSGYKANPRLIYAVKRMLNAVGRELARQTVLDFSFSNRSRPKHRLHQSKLHKPARQKKPHRYSPVPQYDIDM